MLIGAIVLLAGVGVGWFVLRSSPGQLTQSPSPTPSPEATVSVTPAVGVSGAPVAETGMMVEKGGVPQAPTANVNYTDSGFTPNSLTVKRGTTVRFTNQTSRTMWVASGVHPTHQLLPGFDELKAVGKGGTYDYAFVKDGTWLYHNHMHALDLGYVLVGE